MFLTKYYRPLMFLTKSYLWCIASVVCITLVSGGIGGCGGGDVVTPPTETEVVEATETAEVVEVMDRYDGDDIIFVQFGIVHEARVIEGVSKDEVRVRLADGSEQVVHEDSIAGTLIDDHPDIGIEVVMLGDLDKGERRLRGKVADVYGAVRKIEISTVILMEGGREVLDVPRIRYERKDTDFEEGGYLTLDEFAEWLDN